jgi:hypothetical protein
VTPLPVALGPAADKIFVEGKAAGQQHEVAKVRAEMATAKKRSARTIGSRLDTLTGFLYAP